MSIPLSTIGSPREQAIGLLPLLQSQTVEEIRQALRTEDRLPILLEFDLLCLRLPRRVKRKKVKFHDGTKYKTLSLPDYKLETLLKKCRTTTLSPFLRAIIGERLRAGWSHKQILKEYPCGPGNVTAVARSIRASNLKKGRGRRLDPETWKQVVAAAGDRARTNRSIEREFGITCGSVKKARRQLGDYENRRARKKVSDEQIEKAKALLKSGMEWRQTARHTGIPLPTLMRRLSYRKREEDFGFVKLSRERHAAIVAALQSGMRSYHIQKQLRTHPRTIRQIRLQLERAER